MTRSRQHRILGMLVGTALVAAACGGEVTDSAPVPDTEPQAAEPEIQTATSEPDTTESDPDAETPEPEAAPEPDPAGSPNQ